MSSSQNTNIECSERACFGEPARAAVQGSGALIGPGALVLMVVVMAMAVACGRTRRTPDDTLVVLLDGKLRNIDPRFTVTNNDVKFSRLVVPGLTSIDRPSLEPLPDLARSIEQVSEREWLVALRHDVVFSNGEPLSARDVVYTYESTLDPATESTVGGSFRERIARVEALDRYTVRFHLQTPLATFLSDMEFGILSEKAGREGRLIGAGPYQVVDFVPEELLELEVNPHFQGEAPLMPKIRVRTVRDANARALMLVGGSGDLLQNGLRLDLVDAIAERSRIEVDSGPGVILSYFMMNNTDPALSDIRVRQAIAYAIDRQRIVDVKLSGRAALASGFLPSSHWAYEPDVVTYDYDPEKAAKLLDDAGFPDPDGPGGAPRLSLSYKTSADQFRLVIARIIAAQLGEVGIDVTVRTYEFGTFFEDIKKGNYQLATMQTAPLTEPDYYYTYFHSSRIPDPDTLFGHNRWRYVNGRLDELVTKGRQIADRDTRKALYAEVQQILARDVPVIPLWHEDNVVIRNKDVRGYQVLPSGRFGGVLSAYKRTR